ncbi:hypothetical protein JR316_0012585 [Psilocybe cubensis]|uniref:Uncharacterized protein n=1 Tax=Psilocybe cubensis TaxID=181762 RepID=A0ACB8GK82_PSICU|nr:hypothetical protein JR316_0012585 [Psilocybe cubensis]KAH9475474.1 hypothetical protein JR316_0012585 [Psilocybe cubensis]
MQSVIQDLDPNSDSSPPLNTQRLPNYDKPPFVQIEHFPDIDYAHTRPPYNSHEQREFSVSAAHSRYHSESNIPERQRSPDREGIQVSSHVIAQRSQQDWTEEITRELRRISGSSGHSGQRTGHNHSGSVANPVERRESGPQEPFNRGRREMSLPFTPAPYRAGIEEKKSEVRRVIAYYFHSSAVSPQNVHQVVSVITGSTDDYGALLSQLNILGPPTRYEDIGEVYNRLHYIVFGEERNTNPPNSLSYTPVSAHNTSRRFIIDNDPGSISAPNTPRAQQRSPTSVREPAALAAPIAVYPLNPPTSRSTPSPPIQSRIDVGVGSLPARPVSQNIRESSATSGLRTAPILSPTSQNQQSTPPHSSLDRMLSHASNLPLPPVSPASVPLAASSFSEGTPRQSVARHATPQSQVSPPHSLAPNSSASLSSATTSLSTATSTNNTSAYFTALSAKVFHTEMEGIDGPIDFTYTISCSTGPLDNPPVAALEEPPQSGDLLFNQFPHAAQSLRQAQVWMYVDGVSPNEQGVWVNISSNYGSFAGQPIPHPRVPSRCLSVYPGKEGRPRWIKEETWSSNQKKYLAEADKKKRLDIGRASLTPAPSASPSSVARRSSD